MDYMKELERIHKDVLEAKKSDKPTYQIWKLTLAMEYLVTAIMEKERQKDSKKSVEERLTALEALHIPTGS